MDWLASTMMVAFYFLAMPAFLQIAKDVADGDCPVWWIWSIVGAWPIIMALYTIAGILDFLGVPIAKRMFRQR